MSGLACPPQSVSRAFASSCLEKCKSDKGGRERDGECTTHIIELCRESDLVLALTCGGYRLSLRIAAVVALFFGVAMQSAPPFF